MVGLKVYFLVEEMVVQWDRFLAGKLELKEAVELEN
jgi:hypothetical protein